MRLRRRHKRKRPRSPQKPGLYVEEILRWADAWKARTGSWPTRTSGLIPGTPDEKWSAVDMALCQGHRGLRSKSSLTQLLAEFRHVRNRMRLPPYKVSEILAWADAHKRRTGEWPGKSSGPIMDAPGESWMAVMMALYNGTRGLAGGSSLAQLLAEERGRRAFGSLPHLSVKMILAADAHFRRTGAWPHHLSGIISELPEEKWYGVEAALRRGLRGLPGGSSLYKLLVAHGRIKPLEPRGLRMRRLHAGFSRPDLAAKVGVSYDTVVIWEQGRRLPQSKMLAILAGVLGLSVPKLRREMEDVFKSRQEKLAKTAIRGGMDKDQLIRNSP